MKAGRPRRFRGPPPAEIAARRAEASRVKAQGAPGEVRVVSGPGDEIISITRRDVFTVLAERHTISLGALCAVRQLEKELIRAAGCTGSGGQGTRVDASLVPAAVYRRIDADRRCRAILARMHRPFSDLVLALLTPQLSGRPADWRAIVQHVTGIEREEIQADRVRQAAEDVERAIGAPRPFPPA